MSETGVPAGLAKRMASLPVLRRGVDIVLVATATGKSVEQVARVFIQLGGDLAPVHLRHRDQAT